MARAPTQVMLRLVFLHVMVMYRIAWAARVNLGLDTNIVAEEEENSTVDLKTTRTSAWWCRSICVWCKNGKRMYIKRSQTKWQWISKLGKFVTFSPISLALKPLTIGATLAIKSATARWRTLGNACPKVRIDMFTPVDPHDIPPVPAEATRIWNHAPLDAVEPIPNNWSLTAFALPRENSELSAWLGNMPALQKNLNWLWKKEKDCSFCNRDRRPPPSIREEFETNHGLCGGRHGGLHPAVSWNEVSFMEDDGQDGEDRCLEGNILRFPPPTQITVTRLPLGISLDTNGGDFGKIDEVHRGSVAEELGVKPGCRILAINGEPQYASNFDANLRRACANLPMRLVLLCADGPLSLNPYKGQGPVSNAPDDFRVMVIQKPFGMTVDNLHMHVTAVAPESRAEMADVRVGYLLTKVDDQPVDNMTWFDEYQKAQVPFTLTFEAYAGDWDVGVYKYGTLKSNACPQGSSRIAEAMFCKHAASVDAKVMRASGSWEGKPKGCFKEEPSGNFYFNSHIEGGAESNSRPICQKVYLPELPRDAFTDFHCEVLTKEHSFGMGVFAPRTLGWPSIVRVEHQGQAEAQGVRVGDILVEVAGKLVDSDTWEAAWSESPAPFGLKFRRPHIIERSWSTMQENTGLLYGDAEFSALPAGARSHRV